MFHGSKLHLTIEQKNSLKSLMKNTTDKRQYRRFLAILQKSNGRTLRHIERTYSKYQISPEMGLHIQRMESPDWK